MPEIDWAVAGLAGISGWLIWAALRHMKDAAHRGYIRGYIPEE